MRSRGAVELARLERTQEEIAKICSVSRIAVQGWIAGAKKPSAKSREKLKAAYKLTPKWWDEKPIARTAPVVDKPLTANELGDRIRLEATKMLLDLDGDGDRTATERGRVLERVAGVVERLGKMNGGRKLLGTAEWQDMRGKLVEVGPVGGACV